MALEDVESRIEKGIDGGRMFGCRGWRICITRLF